MIPKEVIKLEKFLLYMLSRRPDEFGLLPDEEGFFKIKTVLQALHEEPGWKHVRPAQINTVVAMIQPSRLEIRESNIRACQREQMPILSVPQSLPKLLYTTVRRRAHRSVHANGIRPAGLPFILLSTDDAMAGRIGQRSDPDPVLLTVHTTLAADRGSLFRQFGETLYLADQIAPGTFSGPPLPKEPPEDAKPAPKTSKQRSETPGSYFPDLSDDPFAQQERKMQQRRNEKDRKRQRGLARKEKERQRRQ